MRIPKRLRSIALVPLAALTACAADAPLNPVVPERAPARYSSATQDPPIFDLDAPPGMIETAFEVEGALLNAVVYEPQGPGPHPALVLLHGFPGFERNLDLAQSAHAALAGPCSSIIAVPGEAAASSPSCT